MKLELFSPHPPLGLAIHADRVEAFLPHPGGEPRFCQFSIPEGWVDPQTGLVLEPGLLGKEIRKQLRGERLLSRKAFVAVGGAILRQITLPLPYLPERAELKVAITTEAERYAMFSESEAVVDLLAFEGEEAGIRVLFAAIPRNVAESYQQTLKSAQIQLLSLEPLSLTGLRAMLDREEHPEYEGLLAWSDHSISISTWRGGRLQIWREIERANLEDFDELVLEVMRTVGPDRPPRWRVLAAQNPEGLAQSLEAEIEWTDAEREARIFARGTALETNHSLPKFDLRFLEPAKGKAISLKQALIISGATLYAIAALCAHFVLEYQARTLQSELDETNRRLKLVQNIAEAPASAEETAHKQGIEAFRQGNERIEQFLTLREIIPADSWLTRFEIGEETLTLEGYSLDSRSPLAFALELDRAGFGTIAPPTIEREELEGTKLAHFSLSRKKKTEGQP